MPTGMAIALHGRTSDGYRGRPVGRAPAPSPARMSVRSSGFVSRLNLLKSTMSPVVNEKARPSRNRRHDSLG